MHRDTPTRAALRCPACRGPNGSASIRWAGGEPSVEVVTDGLLECERCDASWPVEGGIAEIARGAIRPADDPTLTSWLRTDHLPQTYPRGLQPDPSHVELLFEHLDARSQVLDLGCGVGGAAFTLAERVGFVLGLDLRRSRIEVCRALLRTGRVAEPVPVERPELIGRRCDFLVGDAVDPPLAGRHWDAVLLSNLYDVVRAPGILLGQAAGLLRPGGLLLFSSPYQWNELSPLKEVADPAADLRHRLEAGVHGDPFEILVEEERLWAVTDNSRRYFTYKTHVVLARLLRGVTRRRRAPAAPTRTTG